ncbi:Exocyst complex component 3 [Thelohanellus kitauei]|uniref:Exocyst complex component 3 n=1 Tax=Thelohanellus kitauei TaxID=669202 RepID=A0A0C2N1Y6_THEKT|nr:Exocyst complex component 3 [Thelohanellus kitauei]
MTTGSKFDEEYAKSVKKEAVEFVKSLFYCPEQLEKLDVHLAKEIKKEKKLAESIKTNVKNHVENISATLKELRISLAEATALHAGISEVETLAKECQKYFKNIEKLINCSQSGSRTSQTLNLLKQIIDMNPKIESTKEMLTEMQLLHVHKNLRQLENIRDRILAKNFDISSTRVTRSYEKSLLVKNFEPIFRLSSELFEKIQNVLKHISQFAVQDPAQLVSALRIIEREEKIDDYWKQISPNNTSANVYVPSDRPKKWASFINQAIAESISESIAKIRTTIDSTDKFATTNYLEYIKNLIFTELMTIQTHAVRCFPPSYQILTRVTQTFHQVISEVLGEILSNLGDTPTEVDIVAILLFEKEYTGEKLFGNKKFNASILQIIRNSEPLLSQDLISKLELNYQTIICESLIQKVARIIALEKRGLENDTEPGMVGNLYCTFLSSFYQDFVGIKITYARRLSKTMFECVFKYCVGAFEQLIANYSNLLVQYRDEQWPGPGHSPQSTGISNISSLFMSDAANRTSGDKGPPKYQHFVQNCIAFANNCIVIKKAAKTLFLEVFDDVDLSPKSETSRMEHIDTSKEEYNNRYLNIVSQADDISEDCLNIICRDYINDLNEPFEMLLTQRWRENAHEWSEGFNNTLQSLGHILENLNASYHPDLYKRIDYSVGFLYLNRFLNFKSKFNSAEVVKFGNIIYSDGLSLCKTFAQKCNIESKDTYSYALVMCAGMFKNPDPECAYLELIDIAATFSDFTDEHAIALLKKREDITKDQIKMVKAVLEKGRQKNQVPKSGVFSEIKVA